MWVVAVALRKTGLTPERPWGSVAAIRRIVAMPVMDATPIVDSVAAKVMLIVRIEAVVTASVGVVVIG